MIENWVKLFMGEDRANDWSRFKSMNHRPKYEIKKVDFLTLQIHLKDFYAEKIFWRAHFQGFQNHSVPRMQASRVCSSS